MAHDVDDTIARLATRQCGVVSRRQLLAAGVSAKEIAARVRGRRLFAVYRGVYAVGHKATSDLGRIFAALLAVPHGVGSHTTAGYLHHVIPTLPPFIEVTVHGRGGRSRQGLVIHETTRPLNVVRRRGVQVTDIRRTLADLDDERATREAVVRGLVPPDSTRVAPTRSNVERRMLDLIRRAGLPRPEVNVSCGPYVLDFLWRDQRVVLEVDTYATHGDRATFEADRRRDADLHAWGFRVLRATDRQIDGEPLRVTATLAATLSR